MSDKRLLNDADYCEEIVITPATDIFETKDLYTLRLEMPGVAKENLQITLDNDFLEVRGEIKEESHEAMEMKYSEYTRHNFYRKFNVGSDIDRNKIEATLENGILTLILHKIEEVKPKKIEVKVA